MQRRAVAALAFLLASLGTLEWGDEVFAQERIRRVGILVTPLTGSEAAMADYYEPFRRSLARQGWIEGNNLILEYRQAHGTPPRFDQPVAELIKLDVDVIYGNNAPATRAAYTATRTIPIIGLDYTNDPVAVGYAESYGRPGGNLTGLFLDAPEFAGKWLQLLKAIVPGLSRVAVLYDPTPGTAHYVALQEAARAQAIQLQILEVRRPDDIDKAFSAFRPQPQAVVVLPSPMTWAQSPRLAKLAAERRLPAISMSNLFPEAGGLLSYGPDSTSSLEQTGRLVAQVLRGVKPGDIPVERPAKFNFIVNLRTANGIGVTIPDSVLLTADRVLR
jgi:putative ABC transport system substrate-binding protein